MLQANILFLGWIYFDKKSGDRKQLWYVYKKGNTVAFENRQYSNHWLGGNVTWARQSHGKKVWWEMNWKELAILIELIYWFGISGEQLRKKYLIQFLGWSYIKFQRLVCFLFCKIMEIQNTCHKFFWDVDIYIVWYILQIIYKLFTSHDKCEDHYLQLNIFS